MNLTLLGSDFPLDLDRPFTYAMARTAGISRRSIAELVEKGLLRRLLRGVYAAAQAGLPKMMSTRPAEYAL